MTATDTTAASAPAAPAPTAVTVLGQAVTVPVEVRSATMVGGTFTAPATAAQQLIDHSGLRVQVVAGTLAVCMVSAVRYTDNDLGPYNELALAIAVHPPDGPGAGAAGVATGNVTTYIHRLPVNQEFTCAAGRDIWGFPKWVADISFQQRPRRTDVVMMDEGRLAAAITVDHRYAVPLPANELEMQCYSWHAGTLRRTPWTMRMRATRVRPTGCRVEVGDENQLADDLRRLGFPKTALVSQSVGHLTCTFGAAEVVR